MMQCLVFFTSYSYFVHLKRFGAFQEPKELYVAVVGLKVDGVRFKMRNMECWGIPPFAREFIRAVYTPTAKEQSR